MTRVCHGECSGLGSLITLFIHACGSIHCFLRNMLYRERRVYYVVKAGSRNCYAMWNGHGGQQVVNLNRLDLFFFSYGLIPVKGSS